MATTQRNRLMTLLGFILVFLVVLSGNYFYIQKISYENELKLNAMTAENVQLSERNKVLMNREKGTVDQLSVLEKENETLQSELVKLKQLYETLQQEKIQLTKEVETLKSVNTQSAGALTQPVIPVLKPEAAPLPTPTAPVLPSETPQINMLQPEKPAATVTEPSALLCPSTDHVNQNLEQGNWAQGKMNWWVEFASRPLDEGEQVGAFFKALTENNSIQAVSCYYQIGEAFIAIKMSAPQGYQIATKSDHWKPCQASESCYAICESADLSQCAFQLETP